MTDMEWRDTATAPKDGRLILAGASSRLASFMRVPYPLPTKWQIGWSRGTDGAMRRNILRFWKGAWCCESGRGYVPYDPQPTHWMPLPPPPTVKDR